MSSNTNRNRNALREAVRYALFAGLASGMAFSGPVLAQDEGEEVQELGRVEITGSRISRVDVEGALPVTVIDREQIELSGEISVADLLRNVTFNSAGSFRPQSGSSAQSFAGISLRALGEARTLVLIDGRRAPVAPNLGQAQDLNSIPLAAVERIEILTDGASAIYGSDAIGGVVNIITRKDFTGMEIKLGGSKPKREGGDTSEFSLIMGMAGDRGSLMAGVSRNFRDIIFARHRPWSNQGASIFSNNFLDLGQEGSSIFLEHPTNGSIVPGEGCTGELFFTGNVGTPSGRCFYNFAGISADEAEIENQSIFFRGTFELSDDWSAYFNSNVSRVKSFGRYAPVPSSPFPADQTAGVGLPYLPAGSPNHPATDPASGGLNPDWNDPFYQSLAGMDLWFTHRFAALGPRDTFTDAHVYDFDVGAKGSLGDFGIEFGVRNTESKYLELGRNYVVGGLAQYYIDTGEYNIYDPFSVTEDVANSMIATINREAIYKAQEVYAIAETDLFNMPAGPVGLAFGAEHRTEDYVDNYDSLSEGGQIVGSAGNSAGGGRHSSAVFFETLWPLTSDLEMNIAGRFDDYSDFGNEFSPKISFRYQPIEELTLRAAYGQGFRAPTLDILTAQPAFSAESAVHPPTAIAEGQPDPNQSIQITTWVISNPNLEAETSDQYSFGAAFQPVDWFNGTVDYYRIELQNTITSITVQEMINCLEGTSQNCPPGLSVLDPNATPPIPDAGLGIAYVAGPGTQIIYAQSGFTNLGTIETDGIDINLQTNFDLGGGRLTNDLNLSYVNSYEVDGTDVVGEAGLPEFRSQLRNTYTIGDFGFAWFINYIDSQETSQAGPPAPGEPDPGVDSWLTHDIQFNWYTPWDGQVTLGVQNATDEDPPLDEGELRGFNFNLYDAYGRIPYLRYTQSF